MSKSHKSRGRGGVSRHIKIHPARQSSGRSHNRPAQKTSGAFGLQSIDDSVMLPPSVIIQASVPSRPTPNSSWVSLDDLKNAVLKPGIEKHLQPLMLYRGCQSMGRIKMMWNFLQLMHLSGVPSASEALKLFQNPATSQLLGPASPRLSLNSLSSFLSRAHDHLKIASLVPGLPDYLKQQIEFRKFNLIKVSEACPNSRWDFRRQAGQEMQRNAVLTRSMERLRAAPASGLFYPYMIYDVQNDQQELVAFVNEIVPRHLTPDLRADVCQEMLLALLTGEIGRHDAHSKRGIIIKRVLSMNGISDNALSIDAPIQGHSLTLRELLVDSEWVIPWDEVDERLDAELELETTGAEKG